MSNSNNKCNSSQQIEFLKSLPTTRLRAICSLIAKHEIIADIGADHGKVSEFIYKNSLAKKLIVNDISSPSLAKAKSLLALNSVNDRENAQNATGIVFQAICGSRLHELEPQINCAVIAGMGGDEIVKIVSNLQCETLVLSPQTKAEIVRNKLNQMSYNIFVDAVIKEKNKFYDVILAKKNDGKNKAASKSLSKEEEFSGKFYRFKNPNLLEKLRKEEQKILKYKDLKKDYKNKLSVIEKAMQWQL